MYHIEKHALLTTTIAAASLLSACCCSNNVNHAQLYVKSDPPLARVFDLETGNELGETPFTHNFLRAGCKNRTLRLELSLPGYQPESRNVTLTEWVDASIDPAPYAAQVSVTLRRQSKTTYP